MQYLHHKGIIYSDLKPANVLLNEYGQLKICDFGLSRRIIDMITADEVFYFKFIRLNNCFFFVRGRKVLRKDLLHTWLLSYFKMMVCIAFKEIFGHWAVSCMSLQQESLPLFLKAFKS